MSFSLLKHINSQPLMRVLNGLLSSSRGRHLRSLASQYSISPAGVSDIVRRLKNLGVIHERKLKNRKYFILDLQEEEAACLKNIFEFTRTSAIRERAARLNRIAIKRFKWIDETRAFYKKVRKNRNEAAGSH